MLPSEFAQYAVVIVGSITALSIVSAVARRIAGPSGRRQINFGAGSADVDALRDEVEQLRNEVAALKERSAELDDVQNRLDFAERLLAQVREKTALPGAK